MKKRSVVLGIINVAALLALVAGCSTTKKTEELLSAANFNIVPATTPAQQERLKTLPAQKVTLVKRGGWDYFVYPDVKQNILYVGGDSEFQRYQQLRVRSEMAQEQLDAADSEDDWGAWGPW